MTLLGLTIVNGDPSGSYFPDPLLQVTMWLSMFSLHCFIC